ncbi:DUF3024 domain-containing protein [Candidatus Poribacteria bacterium]|nr:DUF3024 domain-containing protein [Candidatus Poribacteria bacterium]
MPLPKWIHKGADVILGEFCRTRVPEGLRDEIRLNYQFRGNSVTVIEQRPVPESPGNWLDIQVARFDYDAGTGLWSLRWRDRNVRWHPYPRIEPSKDFQRLLDEVEADPIGIFWG